MPITKTVKIKTLRVLEDISSTKTDPDEAFDNEVNILLADHKVTANEIIDIKYSVHAAPGLNGFISVFIIIYKG